MQFWPSYWLLRFKRLRIEQLPWLYFSSNQKKMSYQKNYDESSLVTSAFQQHLLPENSLLESEYFFGFVLMYLDLIQFLINVNYYSATIQLIFCRNMLWFLIKQTKHDQASILRESIETISQTISVKWFHCI